MGDIGNDARRAPFLNNLIFDCFTTLHAGCLAPVAGNRLHTYAAGTDGVIHSWNVGGDAARNGFEASGQNAGSASPPVFPNAARYDYRPHPGATARNDGVAVRHDFYALIRFADQGLSPGAFRAEPHPTAGEAVQVEIEWADGSCERRWKPHR